MNNSIDANALINPVKVRGIEIIIIWKLNHFAKNFVLKQRNKVAISLLLFCLTSLALSKPSPTPSPNKSQFSRRLVLRKSPANLQLQAVRSSRQIQPPSIPALYSAPKPLESDARTEASSPSPAYGPPSSTTEEATATTEMVTEDSMDDVSTPEPGMSETDADAGENEVDQGTERTEYLPPKKAKDQDMIETNPYQHQIQIHVVPPHLSQVSTGRWLGARIFREKKMNALNWKEKGSWKNGN